MPTLFFAGSGVGTIDGAGVGLAALVAGRAAAGEAGFANGLVAGAAGAAGATGLATGLAGVDGKFGGVAGFATGVAGACGTAGLAAGLAGVAGRGFAGVTGIVRGRATGVGSSGFMRACFSFFRIFSASAFASAASSAVGVFACSEETSSLPSRKGFLGSSLMVFVN